MGLLTKIRDNARAGVSRKGINWTSGNWVDSDIAGNIYSSPVSYFRTPHIPGQHWNFASLVGCLTNNSAYLACLEAYWDAFTEAPLTAMAMGDDGKLVPDPNSPLTALFESLGHTDYSDITMRDCLLADVLGHGNAYLLPVYNGLHDPLELRYVPWDAMRPVFNPTPQPDQSPILYYEYTVGNTRYQVPVDEVINIQLGADDGNPYLGMGRGDKLVREIFTDNEATFFSGAILKNMGVYGRIFTPKDKDAARGFSAQAVVDVMAEQSKGERRGADVSFERPMDIFEPSNSPEKMALDKIRQYPESRICAVMRVPGMVAGLQIGHAQKTYSNWQEARSAFWEDSVMPLMDRISSQITQQLLRRSFTYKKNVWAGFDTRNVKALEEDKHKLMASVIAMFDSGLWDAARALREVGDEPKPEDEGRMSQASTPQLNEGQILRTVNTAKGRLILPDEDEERVIGWAARIEGELAAMEANGKNGRNGHLITA